MDAEVAKIIVAVVMTAGSISVALIAVWRAWVTSKKPELPAEPPSPDVAQHEQTRQLIREQTLEMRDWFREIDRMLAPEGALSNAIAHKVAHIEHHDGDGNRT